MISFFYTFANNISKFRAAKNVFYRQHEILAPAKKIQQALEDKLRYNQKKVASRNLLYSSPGTEGLLDFFDFFRINMGQKFRKI